jgi:tartrate/fumarate subfamily iron-sulfur-dependent hydro-lyase beta chain
MTIKLTTPLKKEDILKLNIGDNALLSGTIFTARDRAYKFFLENDFDKIQNSIIYHCGPIIKNNKVISGGPTTSWRLNQYTSHLIEKYKVQAFIGKGGMDDHSLEAMKGKAVYFSAIGGAACVYAKTMKIKNVYKLEFGMPEAIWEIEIKDFPVIVTMDAKGNSLHGDVYKKSKKVFEGLVNL